MGTGKRIHNWLARRNLGSWLGMEWDSAKDEAYQAERRHNNLTMDVQLAPARLESAERALQRSDYAEASRIAHRTLWRLEADDDGRVPEAKQLMSRAKSIIAKLPPNTSIPPHIQVVSADEYISRVEEVSQLVEAGAHDKALEKYQQLADYEVDSKDKNSGGASLALLAVTAKLSGASKGGGSSADISRDA